MHCKSSLYSVIGNSTASVKHQLIEWIWRATLHHPHHLTLYAVQMVKDHFIFFTHGMLKLVHQTERTTADR